MKAYAVPIEVNTPLGINEVFTEYISSLETSWWISATIPYTEVTWRHRSRDTCKTFDICPVKVETWYKPLSYMNVTAILLAIFATHNATNADVIRKHRNPVHLLRMLNFKLSYRGEWVVS